MSLRYLPPHGLAFYDASVTLGLDAREFDSRLAALENKIASSTKTMGHKLETGLGAGLGSLLGGLTVGAGVKELAAYGAQIYDLGERFGVSTDSLQRFGNAAERNGSSLEGLATGFNKMARARAEALRGDSAMVEAFSRAGISIEDLRSLSPDQIFVKMGESAMNAADMVKIFGRNGLELGPTMRALADGSEKAADVIDKKLIVQLKNADDQFKKIGQSAKIVGATILGGVADTADSFGAAIKRSAHSAGEFVGTKLATMGSVFKNLIHGNIKEANDAANDFISGADRKPAAEATKAATKGGTGSLKPTPELLERQKKANDALKIDADTLDQIAEIKEKSKLTLGELASRDASDLSEGQAVFHGKYIGADISKAKEAEREKQLAEDSAVNGQDQESALHLKRFQSLTQGIGSLKDTEKNPMTAHVENISKKADEIAANTAKPFVNK